MTAFQLVSVLVAESTNISVLVGLFFSKVSVLALVLETWLDVLLVSLLDFLLVSESVNPLDGPLVQESANTLDP